MPTPEKDLDLSSNAWFAGLAPDQTERKPKLGNGKFTAEDMAAIKKRLQERPENVGKCAWDAAIARDYGASRRMIGYIRLEQYWKKQDGNP